MNDPNPQTPSINLLKMIQEFVSELPSKQRTDEIIQSLRADGVDFEKLLKEVTKQAERAENRLRLKAFTSDIKDAIIKPLKQTVTNLDELKRLVEERIASLDSGASVMAFYRKLETAEEEDLQSLLDDFDELEQRAGERHTPGSE